MMGILERPAAPTAVAFWPVDNFADLLMSTRNLAILSNLREGKRDDR